MKPAFSGAFAGRSVLVTGHTGFKGSWLVLWLEKLGARVTGYALPPPTQPNHFEVAGVQELCASHHEADIRDAGGLRAAFEAAAPDVVFHLAAQSLVREGYRSPIETFDVNVMGTCHVLEAVRGSGRPCVVLVVTSDKCYENRERVWGYREIDAMGGHDPYSASKGATELATASYRRSFFPPDRVGEHGVKVASVRAGNVIGGGDWADDRIVPDIARALSAGNAVGVRNPGAIRPWQHVLEPLGGYLTLAARLLDSDDPGSCSGWNFGPGAGGECTVRDVVELFRSAWGSGEWEDQSDPSQPHEAQVLRLSIDKATAELGWRPRWTVGQAVGFTARWYKRYAKERGPMRAASLADLEDYEAAEAKAETQAALASFGAGDSDQTKAS